MVLMLVGIFSEISTSKNSQKCHFHLSHDLRGTDIRFGLLRIPRVPKKSTMAGQLTLLSAAEERAGIIRLQNHKWNRCEGGVIPIRYALKLVMFQRQYIVSLIGIR
jgi:hypothetical protein